MHGTSHTTCCDTYNMVEHPAGHQGVCCHLHMWPQLALWALRLQPGYVPSTGSKDITIAQVQATALASGLSYMLAPDS